jgi:chromosome segregation ATPase
METNQIARMIEWLDEERRRDKARIAKLEERLVQQQDLIDTLTRRQNNLEGDSAQLRTQFVPLGRDAELVEQLRIEINQAVESVEGRRVSAEREAERRAEIARENMLRPFREVGDRMERLERTLEEVSAARLERDRFAAALAALQQRVEDIAKKFEEPDRRLAFLEEQRRQDARRISEVQSELPELERSIEALKPKLDLLEALALRNEKIILDVQASERDRKESMQQFTDQQVLLVQQRDQRMEELARSFGQYDESMRRNFERFETWSEAYRQMKKVIEDFDRIGERLERRINEVAEMQRLSEERFRNEWAGWSADDQKRWKQFTLTNDENWHLHDRDFEQFRAKFNEIIQQFGPLYESLDRLWKLQRAQADLFRDRYQSLLAEHDQPAERPGRVTASVPSVSVGVTNGNGRP